MKLTIVPFESVPGALPREVARRVRSVLPWKVVVSPSVPDAHTDGNGSAADASAALAALPQSGRHDELAVGLTAVHLKAAGLDYVFGYAEPALRRAIVSLSHLSEGTAGRRGGRRLLVERLVKEVLHETGHLMGLEHCDQSQCLMHYSQALPDTDAKECTYCSRCLRELSRLPEPAGER